ncbi:MAG: fluoride efflux transporter CrcB, partial [Bacteroides sp.]
KSVILLGCGGFIGTVLRYAVQLGVNKYSFTSFPLATFLVNIVGCLLIGILYGLATRYEWLNQELQLFLITGLCGGFTTFSTFSYENILLLQKGNYLIFFGYLFLSISLGFTLTWLGFVVAKQ